MSSMTTQTTTMILTTSLVFISVFICYLLVQNYFLGLSGKNHFHLVAAQVLVHLIIPEQGIRIIPVIIELLLEIRRAAHFPFDFDHFKNGTQLDGG
jgi:hypothetical protein